MIHWPMTPVRVQFNGTIPVYQGVVLAYVSPFYIVKLTSGTIGRYYPDEIQATPDVPSDPPQDRTQGPSGVGPENTPERHRRGAR